MLLAIGKIFVVLGLALLAWTLLAGAVLDLLYRRAHARRRAHKALAAPAAYRVAQERPARRAGPLQPLATPIPRLRTR